MRRKASFPECASTRLAGNELSVTFKTSRFSGRSSTSRTFTLSPNAIVSPQAGGQVPVWHKYHSLRSVYLSKNVRIGGIQFSSTDAASHLSGLVYSAYLSWS